MLNTCPPRMLQSGIGEEGLGSLKISVHITTAKSHWAYGHERSISSVLYGLGWEKDSFNLEVTSETVRRRQWHPTPVLLPEKSHGWRNLVGCSPWGRQESDTTERLHFHFSLSCIGEGNGNPLQCSCLENPRDEGACWAAVHGVARSRTRLKQLSSSSSSSETVNCL